MTRDDLEAAAAQWVKHLAIRRRLSPKTVVCYESYLRCGARLLPDAFQPGQLIELLAPRMGSEVTSSVRYNSYVAFMQFFRWWQGIGGPTNPLAEMQPVRRSDARRRGATRTEIEALAERLADPAVSDRDRAIVLLLTWNGLRIGDIKALLVEDVRRTRTSAINVLLMLRQIIDISPTACQLKGAMTHKPPPKSSEPFSLTWSDPQTGIPWKLSGEFAVDVYGLRCIGLSVELVGVDPSHYEVPRLQSARDPKPTVKRSSPPRPDINTRLLRALPLATLLRGLAEARARDLEALGGLDVVIAAITRDASAMTKRQVSHVHYRQVAAVYSAAMGNGSKTPGKVIAEKFGVSRAAAATWVRRARQYGYLPPAPGRGQAGVLEEDHE